MFPKYTTIDTLKEARGKFRFNSNRLDYIGKFLGLGQKVHTGFDLWKDIMLKNCAKSMLKMLVYCRNDVRLLENVFNRLNPYIPPKSRVKIEGKEGAKNCPECGGKNLRANMYRNTLSGRRVQLRCADCGKTHQIPESKWIK